MAGTKQAGKSDGSSLDGASDAPCGDPTPYEYLRYDEGGVIDWLKWTGPLETHGFVFGWVERWSPLDLYFPVLDFIVNRRDTDLGTILTLLTAFDDMPMPPPFDIGEERASMLSEFGEPEDRYCLMKTIAKNARNGMYASFNHRPPATYAPMRAKLIETYSRDPEAWFFLPQAFFRPEPEA